MTSEDLRRRYRGLTDQFDGLCRGQLKMQKKLQNGCSKNKADSFGVKLRWFHEEISRIAEEIQQLHNQIT